jgi:hypothetical protein
MRFKPTMAFGLALALPVLFVPARVESNDGILRRVHQHCDSGSCPATVVQLPAQQIRIETAAPRVVVGSSRHLRGFMPAGPMFMPVTSGPFVATIFGVNGTGTTGTGSPMLDSIHAMEAQHMQFAKQQASLQKEIELTNQAAQRVSERLAATLKSSPSCPTPTPTPADVDARLKGINDRLDAIERLLIIHDNILKDIKK